MVTGVFITLARRGGFVVWVVGVMEGWGQGGKGGCLAGGVGVVRVMRMVNNVVLLRQC
jgi:hypothetical protein